MSEMTPTQDEHAALYEDPKLAEAARAFEGGAHAHARRLLGEVGAVEGEDAVGSARLREALTLDRMTLVVAGGMFVLWLFLAWRVL